MKTLVKINKKENINSYISLCDGFIVGLEDFSIDYDDTFNIEEIESLTKLNKEIFVAINKNIFNSELDILKEKLFMLDKLKIKGILFYDLSILYIKKHNNLNIDLVWNQTHMVTNYNTCNYYYEKGVKYGFISGEITKDEILEINKKSNMNFLVTIVAHQVMSCSRRLLLSNYYNSINKKYDGSLKQIKEHDKTYLIKENKDGTVIKTSEILNGISIIPELLENNISYIVVDESYIEKEKIEQTLKLIEQVKSGSNREKCINDSYLLLGDNTSFLFKKTIYKVKRGAQEWKK